MKVVNPIFNVDMPDPDIIRVEDVYYMVSTTMFFMPGGMILKSKDLVNWDPCSYIFEQIEDNDTYELKNGKNAYGKGQWATSLTYYKGLFYACFVCHDMCKTYIYYTDDIEKTGWNRHVINDVFHDMSFLFLEDIPYLIYGNGTIYAVELEKDLSGVKLGGFHKVILETPKEHMRLCCEGCRAYIRNGYIYLSFIDIPDEVTGSNQRRQVCYRSKSIEGPYERRIILDDNFGLNERGVAQGPFIEDEDGDWYAMLFQDRGSCGRMPLLMPMSWIDDWPTIGVVPYEFEIKHKGEQRKNTSFIVSDTFNHVENKLNVCWQWNHNPLIEGWSFTDNPGYLTLKVLQPADNLLEARNTLTQRTIEPGCMFSVELDASGLKDGDYAGLCAFMSRYGQIGVCREKGVLSIKYIRCDSECDSYTERVLYDIEKSYSGISIEKTCNDKLDEKIYLAVEFDYKELTDKAYFYISYDGVTWEQFGDTLQMEYTLDIFVGYRIGLFMYGNQSLGGYACFKDFVFDCNYT